MAVPLVAGFMAGLWGLFKASAPAAVFYIMSSLGVGLVTYTGLTVLVDNINAQVATQFGSLSSSIAAIVALAGFDEAIKIIISAYSVRLALSGFVGGSKTFFKLRNPAG